MLPKLLAPPALVALTALWTVTALAQLPTLAPLDAQAPITYFIADGEAGSAYRDSDRELATWALEAWRRASNGTLQLEPAPEDAALLRVYFVPASAGQYGEMRPLMVQGRRGAAVYVRPNVSALGPDIARAAAGDPLLREAIVYLTCLHELGHALGLAHTAEHEDVMYYFGYGGDVPRFFGRYRERLRTRADIARNSGLSSGDVARLLDLY